MSDETITINKVEMKSILPQLRKWWNEYQSGKLNLDGKINIACVIGERGGRIIMEFEALHTQVEQAEEREKVVTATYQAQQQSYRELEAVYSACVEDKQQAERGRDVAIEDNALLISLLKEIDYSFNLSPVAQAFVDRVRDSPHPGRELMVQHLRQFNEMRTEIERLKEQNAAKRKTLRALSSEASQ